MRLVRYFDEGLAHASYLLASDRAREAVVIDPRRDIDVYLAFGAQHGLRLTAAIETHVHADFVSGARALGLAGATTICGPGAGLQFPHRQVSDGDTMRVGDLRLTFLHTPGHTPEHISILVEAGDGEPAARRLVFTGDTLFVGAVGRPDLLGEQHSGPLANQLYDSLTTKLLTLDDAVEVHPGHGAGSLCGKDIGREPHSTIGFERRFNRWLQHPSREAFVAAVLADLPETPSYFARMKRLNAAGPPPLGDGGTPMRPPRLDARTAAARLDAGAWLLDLRDAAAFGAAHPLGAINIGFGARVGYWAGWVLPAGAHVVLLDDDQGHIETAVRQLVRVGADDIDGVVDGGFAAWRAAGLPEGRIEQIEAAAFGDLVARGAAPDVIDVRTRGEWRDGHVPGAYNLPAGDLPARLGDVPGNRRVFVMCEGGYRSSLAASLLARSGHPSPVNVQGGFAAYRALRAHA